MIQKGKGFLFIWFLFFNLTVHGQNVEGIKAFEIRYGRTGLPGDIFKIGHERYLGQNINISFWGGLELSKRNLLNYSSYSFDVMVDYYTSIGYITNDRFQVKLGIGGSLQYNNENSLLKDYSFSQKLNLGVIGSVTGEWAFSQDFSITLNFTQGIYSKKELGYYQYHGQIGLKYKLF